MLGSSSFVVARGMGGIPGNGLLLSVRYLGSFFVL